MFWEQGADFIRILTSGGADDIYNSVVEAGAHSDFFHSNKSDLIVDLY